MYLIASEMYQGVPRTNMNQPLRTQSQCTVANLIQLKKGLMRTTQKIGVERLFGKVQQYLYRAQKVLFMTPLSPLSVKSLQAVCSIPPLNTS